MASPETRHLSILLTDIKGFTDKTSHKTRAVFSLISGYALFLGYLWALWEPQRRTWHDLIAGTKVVPAE